MKAFGNLILTAFFLLELCAMVAFGYWGYHIQVGVFLRIILAVAVPLIVAILWGMLLSPKASFPIFSYPVRNALKLIVFAGASAALYASGLGILGIIFLALSLLLAAAVFVLKLHEVK